MNFTDYDRISDTVLFFDNNIVLDFIVTLSSKDRNGNRIFFHTECNYDSNKYYGVDKGHSIKRRMSFYFVINDKRAFDRSFLIKPEDAMMLTMIIEAQILPWYFDPKRKIFSIIEGQLKITGKYQDVMFAKNEYNYLRICPCVYAFEDNTYKEGVRMYVSSDSVYVDMEIDKFLGFYYFISRTDMYSAACSLASYVKTPPYEVNTFNMNGLAGATRKQMLDSEAFFIDNGGNTRSDIQTRATNDFLNRAKKKKKNDK